ncbi:hypothetical protein LOC67_21035 [Stieleria sp. JC731]|uniref:hypothetical protein n=1 Tax=Pirellulaceae TaxID=2691357 RepID=UPI001E43E2A0|nr:hypothetical protein [Stieleria sp. JC731]MCC9603041.1 hypothetical protein [Stieleria sp. JC731]
MILIATDEAGYGPKLGPLVIAASVWRIPDEFAEDNRCDAFAALRETIVVNKARISVNDSKSIFKPKSRTGNSPTAPTVAPYHILQWVTLAGWFGCSPERQLMHLSKDLAPYDHESLLNIPWLESFANESLDSSCAKPIWDHWDQGAAKLLGMTARVICAAEFNSLCERGLNKSDILGELTLQLVRDALDENSPRSICRDAGEAIEVFCDRHGGRRYYAGPLQSAFDGTLIQVVNEGKGESRYNVPFQDEQFGIRFTVKGDTFTPVAFSSMVAKYLREKSMESLNNYFAAAHKGDTLLRPTAGYPVDADRFIEEISPIMDQLKIEQSRLVRCR